MDVRPLAKFINERWRIHVKRSMGASAPWTDDEILRKYRFCNIRREDDRVTRWIHNNWLKPKAAINHLWFAMAVARIVNLPESLNAIGFPVPWKADKFKKAMAARKAAGHKVFTSAYMIHADAVVTGSKADYLADYVLTPMWDARTEVSRVLEQGSLRAFHERLMEFRDMGSFMAAQIVADTKWIPSVRMNVRDWLTFAAMGPGSQRGMSWVEFGDANTKYSQTSWRESLLELREKLLPKLDRELQNLDCQNIQSCLCEWDKYCRVKHGQGRPKQNFKPSSEPYA